MYLEDDCRGHLFSNQVLVRCTTASRERLFAIISMRYEAELHSQAGSARWRRGPPERCPAPQFSQSGGGTRGYSIGDQPGGARSRGARRRSALHTNDAQCRPDGSPEYLCRRGRPERIEDLRQHACLRLRRSNGSIAPWSFVSGNKPIEAIVSGPLIAHDFPTLLGAAVEDMGLAQVPGPIAAGPVTAGKLVHVLERFAPMAPAGLLYYPSRHQMMPKLRAFIDHVKSRSDGTDRTRIHIDDKRTRGM